MKIDMQKIVQVINFFAIKEGGQIDYIKALKLVYLADKLMLCRYGRMITNDRYAALKNGPVPSATKNMAEGIVKQEMDSDDFPAPLEYCKKYLGAEDEDSWNITSRMNFDEDYFSKAEVDSLVDVYQKFGQEDKWHLCDEITHKFQEWYRHGVDGVNKKYAQMEIIDFFLKGQSPELDQFFNPDKEDLALKMRYFIQTREKLFTQG